MISTDSRDTALPVTGNHQAIAPEVSVVPLRLGAVILATVGIFPLAAVIKYAKVVDWLPAAAVEWLAYTTLLIIVCVIIARSFGDRPDRLIDRVTAALLAPAPREFVAWAALIVLAASIGLSWYCFNLGLIGL